VKRAANLKGANNIRNNNKFLKLNNIKANSRWCTLHIKRSMKATRVRLFTILRQDKVSLKIPQKLGDQQET